MIDNCAARLILTQLKLDDLLRAELMRLQQQSRFHQAPVLDDSRPVTGSASSQSSGSATCSLPFELPDVNISDLLDTTVQSPNNFLSSATGRRQISSSSLPVSAAISSSLQQKKLNNRRKKVGNNCTRNNLTTNVNDSATADDSQVRKLSSRDSRKRQTSELCTSALDSDDEFVDFCGSNIAKKLAQEVPQNEQEDDCRSAVAREVVDRTDVESSSKQNVTSLTNDSRCTSEACSVSVTLNSGLQQRNVAQRLSKFAFKDSSLQQQQLSARGTVASDDQLSTQHTRGKYRFITLYSQDFEFVH